MAAHLQRRDRASALAAVAATEEMLADLGAPPEDATAMLIRQVRHRASAPEAGVVHLADRVAAVAAG